MSKPPSLCATGRRRSKFSSAKPMGSILAWQAAQDAFARCGSILLPHRHRLSDGCLLQRRHVRRGGGGGAPRRFSSTHLPRITGEVRVGYDVTASARPWSTRRRAVRPAIRRVGSCRLRFPSRRNSSARRWFRYVYRASRKSSTLRSSSRRLRRTVSVSRCMARAESVVEFGIALGVGLDAREVSEVQPLPGEVRGERRGSRVGQHAADLCPNGAGAASTRRVRRAPTMCSSGMLLHRKNERREASARSDKAPVPVSTRNRKFGDTRIAFRPSSMPPSNSP